MQRNALPTLFEEIGILLEIKGENPFKVNAYVNAARMLSGLENLEELAREKRLREVKGIGDALAAKIAEYYETGKIGYLDELKQEIPGSLIELLQIPNLGPKKIKVLFERLGITNTGELEYACKENRLVTLPGFGQKSQEKILKGIDFLKRHKGEFLFGDVYLDALAMVETLRTGAETGLVEVCGSLRRRKETVRDIDILVAGVDGQTITDRFVALPEVDEVLLRGDTKTSCRLRSGIDADLRVVNREAFPSALMYFTGSKEHNVRLRGLAKDRGWKLNEYGLFDQEKAISLGSEEEIYRMLGLSYIPPELREDLGEIEAAGKGLLPELVTLRDMKGTFHVHTDFSDGAESLERMVQVAIRQGYSYVGISDHSRSAYYAGGLKVDDLKRQWEVIDGLNERLKPFRIFKGIESDILPDGSLDYEEEILAGFDFVIGSVHSGFNMSRADQEERILRAMENPWMTMLGHPTGRLLLSREGYDVDMHTLIDGAAKNNVIIELNASPYRFDIDWRYLRYAKEKGVMISINPDAHAAAGYSEILFGVGIARKGWLEKKDVLNTMDVNDIVDTFRRLRVNGKRR
jgi:DNA polymerase (family 10)